MKKIRSLISAIVLSACALPVAARDYVALEAASLYTMLPAADSSEPSFIAGGKLTWAETMNSLIKWNKDAGKVERAAYLELCKVDKAYYFAQI